MTRGLLPLWRGTVKNTGSGSRANKSGGLLPPFFIVPVLFLSPAVMSGNGAGAVSVVFPGGFAGAAGSGSGEANRPGGADKFLLHGVAPLSSHSMASSREVKNRLGRHVVFMDKTEFAMTLSAGEAPKRATWEDRARTEQAPRLTSDVVAMSSS